MVARVRFDIDKSWGITCTPSGIDEASIDIDTDLSSAEVSIRNGSGFEPLKGSTCNEVIRLEN